ncbi:spore coat protein [Haloechinothrix salitolerans]|uniref:Spore coat protein n=1 Tax=Haloechinothrix salitolerans TaxID=926830 RepID=A0ABW2CAT2_9PSEU
MTRLLLRSDASGAMGIGHVGRAVAFAEEATARGWQVTHSGTVENADWLVSRLDELGVKRVPAADGPAALGVLAADADVVLVDHYDLDELRDPVNAAGALLVSVEGGTFGRRAADIVVDAALRPHERPDDGSPTVLTGPRYAPIRRTVRDARERRSTTSPDGDPPRVVVVLGGGSLWRDTVTALLTALRDTEQPFHADVLAHGDPDVPTEGKGQRFDVVAPHDGLPNLFADADLVISAAGITLTELCCIGSPAAVVQLVDNQAMNYEAAVELGVAAGLGTAEDLAEDNSGAVRELRRLLTDREPRVAYGDRAADIVDGDGGGRVLDVVTEQLAEAPKRPSTAERLAAVAEQADADEPPAESADSSPSLAEDAP